MRGIRSWVTGAVVLALLVAPYFIVADSAVGNTNLDRSQATLDEEDAVVPEPAARQSAALFGLPLSFETNVGQANDEVRFIARGGGHRVLLSPTAMSFVLRDPGSQAADPFGNRRGGSRVPVGLAFAHAEPGVRIEPLEPLPGIVNYLIGPDPSNWLRQVPTYTGAVYRGLYPGIDLYVWGDRRRVEYEFVLVAGTDLDRILLDATGTHDLWTDDAGDLVLRVHDSTIRLSRPVITQRFDGETVDRAADYLMTGGTQIGFIGYDHEPARELRMRGSMTIVDGSPGSDEWGGLAGAISVATDSDGYTHVAGRLAVEMARPNAVPASVPTRDRTDRGRVSARATGDAQGRPRSLVEHGDAFVAKLGPDGKTLLYTTYFGDAGDDVPQEIAVDTLGRVVVVGRTTSQQFPTVDARQSHLAGASDAFAAKLSEDGSEFVFSTLLGGTAADDARTVALDSKDDLWVAGTTRSGDFPTTDNALQRALAGGSDGFLVKLDATGSNLRYSGYFGGSADDEALAAALDEADNVLLTGVTASADLPLLDALQSEAGGGRDAFVAKWSADGSTLLFSTYLGGLSDDSASAIAVGNDGSLFVAGATGSPDFPLLDAVQPSRGGAGVEGQHDAFVARMDIDGRSLIYSTFLGGDADDRACDIEIDSDGHAIVAGVTRSPDFPTAGRPRAETSGASDAFVTRLDAEGRELVTSTLVGGSADDLASSIALVGDDDLIVAGTTQSHDLLQAEMLEPASIGGSHFLARIDLARLAPSSIGCATATRTFDGDTSLEWNLAANWSGDTLPVDGDDVCIDGFDVVASSGIHRMDTLKVQNAGSLTITNATLTIDVEAQFDDTLTQTAGAMDGDGDVSIGGLFTWEGGRQGGTGTTTANGGILFDTNSNKTVSRPVVNPAPQTATWLDGGININVNGAFFDNQGTFLAQHADNHTISSNASRIFINSGTFTKQAPALGALGTTTIAYYQNNGTMTVEDGTLLLGGTGGESTAGDIVTQATATLNFSGGTHDFDSASSVSGAGDVLFSFPTVNFNGDYDVSGLTTLNGGTFTVNSTGTIAVADLLMTGGTLTGSSDIPISGLLTWESGTMSGTGTTTANGGILFDTNSGKTVSRPVVNPAMQTTTWLDGTISINVNGAVFDNQGTFLAQHADDHSITGNTSRIFNNAGTFTKQAPALGALGTTTIGYYQNSGTMTVEAGTLLLGNGGGENTTGDIVALANTDLTFNGGTHDFDANSSVSGAGDVLFSFPTVNVAGDYSISGLTTMSGGTVNFDSAGTIAIADLLMNGGTLSGASDVPVSGLLTWESGTMSGTGTTTANGGILFDTNGSKTVGRPVVNPATQTTTWLDGNISINVNGAVFDNQGTFLARHADNHTITTNASRIFNNAGTFTKQAPSLGVLGTTTIGYYQNSGTMTVEAGTLSLGNTGGNNTDGDIVAQANTDLIFNGGTHNLDVNSSISGAGDVLFSFPTVNIAGEYSISGLTTMSGGTVNFNTSGTIAIADLLMNGGTLSGASDVPISGLLTWESGTMSGTGTTTANGGIRFDTNSTKSVGRPLVNPASQTTTWLDGGISINVNGAVFDNQGTFLARHADNHTITSNTSRVFINSGTFTKEAPAFGVSGTTTIGYYQNSGTMTVEDGTLSLGNTGGQNTDGDIVAQANTNLTFNGGTHNLDATSSISGAGDVLFSFPTVNIAGDYDVSGLTTMSGGTVNFDTAGTIAIADLLMNGGTLSGASDVPISGLLTWEWGTMSGTGTTTANGGIRFDTNSAKTVNRPVVNPAGQTTRWLDGSIGISVNGATFDNQGTFLAQHADDHSITGNASRIFNNAGTFTKQSPPFGITGTTTINFYTNSGTMTVEAGTVLLGNTGGDSTGGTWVAQAATELIVSGGAHNFDAASSISGAGNVTFSFPTVNFNGDYNVTGLTTLNGGTLNINSTGSVAIAAFTQTGGTLDGSTDLPISGLFTWDAGTQQGTGTTTANGGTVMGTGGFKAIGRVLVNPATQTATWLDGQIALIADGARIDNFGTFLVQHADNDFLSGSANRTFNNAGTFLKQAPQFGVTGTTTISTAFMNSGTTEIQAGTLNFSTAGLAQTAGATILNGGDLTSTVLIDLQGGRLGGFGTIATSVPINNAGGQISPGLSPGILGLDGDYVQLAGGSYVVEIGGLIAGTEYDQFNLVPPAFGSNDATLAGGLDVTLINGFVPDPGDSFTIMTFDNRSGEFNPSLINLETLSCGRDWNVVYGATDVILEVVATTSADLTVTKSDNPDPVAVGDALSYTVTVANSGPDDATGVLVVDTLPAGVTFDAGASSAGCNETSPGVVTCDVGTVANGANSAVSIVVTPTSDGVITNSVSASSDLCDPNPGDETDITEDTTVVPVCPDADDDTYADCETDPSCLVSIDDVCGDCDDTDAAVNPGATELCGDTVDNDCDAGTPDLFDGDNDGSTCDVDCDDADAGRFPGNPELCDDGVDQDCDAGTPDVFDGDNDGSTCDVDCDDNEANVFPGNPELCNDGLDNDCDAGTPDIFDTDNDGSTCDVDCDDANANCTTDCTDVDTDGYCVTTDCDDNAAAINPGAAEICDDGLDNDCDGLTDLVSGVEDPDCFLPDCVDGDNDTYVDCDGSCTPVPGDQCGECDDTDATVNPGAAEVCADSVDNDCDAGTPDIFDGDNDGSTCDLDCDDADAGRFPGNPELCDDGVDQDCDAGTPDIFDGDNDGSMCDLDCDDDDASRFPGNPEVCDDAIDNDCDAGTPDIFDGDNDGATCDLDCDDADSGRFPGNPELCDDGVDQDCDAGTPDIFDGDNDGATCDLDCDDADAGRFPGNPELCDDGIDQDCDAGTPDIFDGDNDGSTCDLDCDDADAGRFPGNPELCDDGVDQDCDAGTPDIFDGDNDGSTCDLDCDDADAGRFPGNPELCDDGVDQDCDAGTPDIFDGDNDGSTCDVDCDDNEANVFPGNTETCNDGLDNDCDAGTPDIFDTDNDGSTCDVDCDDANANCTTDCTDADTDGYCVTTDCDDNAAAINPGAAEICDDGLDNDCDGLTDLVSGVEDPDCFLPDCVDGDDDTYVDCDGSCTPASGDQCGECDDTDATVNPGAAEICDDTIDNDCDAGTPDLFDGDNDGATCDIDCDDADAGRFPGNPELCADMVDNDCDAGTPDIFDGDNDGATCDVDCDDDDASRFPGNPEVCDDAIDNDCDAGTPDIFDGDSDGSTCDLDCDDADAGRFPGNPELCDDGVDQDCDAGTPDVFDGDNDGSTCDVDCDDNEANVFPGNPELCNDGLDNDCDAGTPDIFDTDNDGSTCDVDCDDANANCTTDCTDADTDGYCVTTDCDDNAAAINPGAAEICDDGLDNDCDGLTDLVSGVEDPDCLLPDCIDGDNDTYVDCDGSCTPAPGDQCGECDDTDATVNPGAEEVCADTVDNDCDAGTPDIFDGDNDGSTCDLDCDDADAGRFPGNPELCDDGVDQDCDAGTPDIFDGDNDGSTCDLDCDDDDASRFPGNPEVCDDAIDNDCDAGTPDIFDGDTDGATCDADCDDADPDRFPGNPELCDDGVDQDCDAGTPDIFDGDNDGSTCDVDCDDNEASVFPGNTEVCNDGLDNDCDAGTPDIFDTDSDGVTCDVDCDDANAYCTTDCTDADTDGYCVTTDCDDANAAVNPAATEICDDSIDNDCDGLTDLGDLDCLEIELCAVLGDQSSGNRDFDEFFFDGALNEMVSVSVAIADGEEARGLANVFFIDSVSGEILAQDRSALDNGFEVVLPAAGRYQILIGEPSLNLGRTFAGRYCVSVDGDQGAGATLTPGSTVEPTESPGN